MGVGLYTISNMSDIPDVPSDYTPKSRGSLVIRVSWGANAICTFITCMDSGEIWCRPTDTAEWHKN